MALTYSPAPGATINVFQNTLTSTNISGTLIGEPNPAASYTTTFSVPGLVLTPPIFPTYNPVFVINGTPTVLGPTVFNIILFDQFGTPIPTDGSGNPTKTWILNVNPFQCPTITINPPTLPNGSLGVPYNQMVSASPITTPPISYGVIGSLPDGLNLNPLTGAITGTPTTPGVFDFDITSIDGNNCSGQQPYTIIISSPKRKRGIGTPQTFCCDPKSFKDGVCPPQLRTPNAEYVNIGNGCYVLVRRRR